MIDWWGPILARVLLGSEGVGLTLIDSAAGRVRLPGLGRPRVRKGDAAHRRRRQARELPAGATGLVCFSGVRTLRLLQGAREDRRAHPAAGLADLRRHRPRRRRRLAFLTDRQDDMIISGGVNVYPQEIEAAMLGGAWAYGNAPSSASGNT